MTSYSKPIHSGGGATLLVPEKVRANGHTPGEDELDIAGGVPMRPLLKAWQR